MAFLLHELFAKDLVLHILAVKLFDTLIVVGREFYLTQWISSDCIGVKGNIVLLYAFPLIYFFDVITKIHLIYKSSEGFFVCVRKGYM